MSKAEFTYAAGRNRSERDSAFQEMYSGTYEMNKDEDLKKDLKLLKDLIQEIIDTEFNHLYERIEKFEKYMEERFDDIEKRMKEAFSGGSSEQ